MFHVELRQFPHNACRFNLSEAELRAIVIPWAEGQAVELGERKWSPHTGKLTVLEGPQLDMQQLAMGKGWRNAQRRSRDVTERVLDTITTALAQRAAGAPDGSAPDALAPTTEPAGARSAVAAAASAHAAGPAVPSAPATAPPDALALSMQVAGLLGPDPMALLGAWRAAALAAPELTPSQSLARAEQTLRGASAGPA